MVQDLGSDCGGVARLDPRRQQRLATVNKQRADSIAALRWSCGRDLNGFHASRDYSSIHILDFHMR